MKIKRLSLLLIGLTLIPSANAQEQSTSVQDKSFLDRCFFDANVETGMKQHGIDPLFLNFSLGYNFTPQLYGFVKSEYQLGLQKEDGVKTYRDGNGLGIGIGYQLDKTAAHGVTYDLKASFLNSIGHTDWKNTTYDIGITMHGNTIKKKVLPYIGVGFKYVNSHTHEVRNYCGLYASIGIRY